MQLQPPLSHAPTPQLVIPFCCVPALPSAHIDKSGRVLQHTVGSVEGLSATTEEVLGSMGAEVRLVTREESLVWVDTDEEPRTTEEVLASMGVEVWLVARVE
jgi:hypothetical protein